MIQQDTQKSRKNHLSPNFALQMRLLHSSGLISILPFSNQRCRGRHEAADLDRPDSIHEDGFVVRLCRKLFNNKRFNARAVYRRAVNYFVQSRQTVFSCMIPFQASPVLARFPNDRRLTGPSATALRQSPSEYTDV
jgi:hypothetical protein